MYGTRKSCPGIYPPGLEDGSKRDGQSSSCRFSANISTSGGVRPADGSKNNVNRKRFLKTSPMSGNARSAKPGKMPLNKLDSCTRHEDGEKRLIFLIN